MPKTQFDEITAQVEKLSASEKLRLLEFLLAFFEDESLSPRRLALTAFTAPEMIFELRRFMAEYAKRDKVVIEVRSQKDWHTRLRETYGILADDPIRRWPQGEYEERDEIE